MDLYFRLYSQNPQPAQPPILVLHGLFGEGENWASYARLWSANRPVVLVDLPLHGHSHGTAPDLAYAAIADDLAAKLQSGHFLTGYPGPWVVLGHSMGGKVAMMLALRHPQTISSLIVVDMAPKRYTAHHQEVFAAIEAVDLERIASRSDADAAIGHLLPDPRVRGFLLKSLVPPQEGQGWHWKFDVAAIREAYDGVMDWPNLSGASWRGPTRFIVGSESDFVLDADWPSIGELFPAFTRAVVPDAGHWVQADNREGLLAALQGFID